MTSPVQVAVVNVTLAELNAGKILIMPKATVQLRVTGLVLRVNGALGGATDIRISDIDSAGATAADLLTVNAANATDGARHSHLSGTNTLGAAFWAALTGGRGLQLRKTGSTATGTTSVDVLVEYIFQKP